MRVLPVGGLHLRVAGVLQILSPTWWMMAEAGGVSGGHRSGRRRGGHRSGVDGVAAGTVVEWVATGVGLGKVTAAKTLTRGTGQLTRPGSSRLLAGPTRPKHGSGALDVQTKFFSLLNRWKPARGVLWHNYNKPECLLAYSSTLSVRQQTTTTVGVRQPISPFII